MFPASAIADAEVVMATRGSTVQRVTSYPRWFVPVAIVLGLAALAGALAGYDELGSVGPDPALGWGAVGASAAALLAIVLAYALTKRELIIDADGIEQRGRGGRSTRILWSEPHDFCYLAVEGSGMPAALKASVRTPDGRRIDIDDTPTVENPSMRLPRLVDQYSTTANWPKIRARLQAGEDVQFGMIRLSTQRLEVGAQSYPADRPLSLQVEKEQIQVGAEGNWTASGVSVLDVFNYPSLLRAIGQVTQTRAPL